MIAMDSPINTVNTPMIIGFLTCPYIPSTINFFGGLQGASVPFPVYSYYSRLNLCAIYATKRKTLILRRNDCEQ
jgi:hypothetical protein